MPLAMPPDTASIFGLPIELVSVVISAITGFLSGLLGYNYQRWLQRRGKVTARVESWHFGMKKIPAFDSETQTNTYKDVNEVSKADWASFDLEVFIRNEKETAVEVRDPTLVFGKGRNDIFSVGAEGPPIPKPGRSLGERYDVRLTVVLGEQSKILELSGRMGKGTGSLMKLPSCDRVDFVASYSKGKVLRQRIALLEVEP